MTYPEFYAEWHDGNDFCTVHTSGSTGIPKKLRLSKALMRMSAGRTVDFFGIPAGSRIHSCISPDFIGGKMMAVRAAEYGLRLTWETPSNRLTINPSESTTTLESAEAAESVVTPALVAAVPSQMISVLKNPTLAALPGTVWLIGGAPLSPELRTRIAEAGIEAWESYGMTETASHIALRRVTDTPLPFTPLDGVSVGLDPRGCLTITQPFGGTITTNDIASITPDGGFFIRGRADNVIITGGKKVHPEEVEQILLPFLSPYGVSDVMLTSEPDIKWGERVVLLLEYPEAGKESEAGNEAASGIGDEAMASLRTTALAIAARHLHPFQVPKEVRIYAGLPRTPNGKLRRHGTGTQHG